MFWNDNNKSELRHGKSQSRLNYGNASEHSAQNPLSSHLLFKNMD